MKDLFSTPLFGVLISLITFEIGCYLNKKTKFTLFNPLLVSITLIIILLKMLGVSYEDYNKGGQLISFFLGPSTVILALPLYRKVSLLKSNAVPILIGILVGSVTSLISIILLSKLFGVSVILTKSILPKSITTPIGIEVSRQLGGIPAITIVSIVIAGVTGSVIGPDLLRLFKIDDKVAVGTAMGTASHALGTARALEVGEVEGAMSGLTIGIAGLFTVILAPVIWAILEKLLF